MNYSVYIETLSPKANLYFVPRALISISFLKPKRIAPKDALKLCIDPKSYYFSQIN